MMPWRKIAVLGFGASLVLGCTVTTSDGGVDSGIYGSTGGTGNQGGAASTGGNANGGASTIIVCDPASENNACAKCLQSADGTAPNSGMCNEYKPCAAVSGCTAIINAMANCMASKADTNGNLPATAKGDCLTETPTMTTATAAGQAAITFWTQIEESLYCAEPCWAI